MAPIGDWLRETRERQVRPDGEKWSQDDFLAELQRATGWHLHRPNYSRYESGRSQPKRDTLARLVGFWAARGEPGPDLSPKVEPAPVDPVAAAIDRQTAILAELVAELRSMRAEGDGVAEALTSGLADLRATLGAVLIERGTGTGVVAQ